MNVFERVRPSLHIVPIVWCIGGIECSVVYHNSLKWNTRSQKVNFPGVLAPTEITHSWLLLQKVSVCISDYSHQAICPGGLKQTHRDSKLKRSKCISVRRRTVFKQFPSLLLPLKFPVSNPENVSVC